MQIKRLFPFLFLSLAGLCIISCNSQKKSEFQHKIEDYDDPSDYRMSTKEEFVSFLNKYYSKMKLQKMENVRTKQELIDGYVINKQLPKFLIPWNIKNLKAYNQEFKEQTTEGVFNFHLSRKKDATKTLFYMHDNLTSVTLSWEFSVEFSIFFPNHNIVMIDLTNVNRVDEVYDTDKINEIFEKEFKSFLKDYKLTSDELYLNIVCHSYILSHKFLKSNQSIYKKLIYYTPMVSKSPDDKIMDTSLIFEPNREQYLYDEMSMFYTLPRGHNQRTKYIPIKHYVLNLKSEHNFMKSYFNGLDLKGIKDAWLIYPEREEILTAKSMHISQFKPERVYELKGMYHNDYYTHKEKRKNYYKLIKHIIEGQ